MKAVLSTEVPVIRVAVFAEIAWLERRPELGLLCRAVRDHERQRISPALVQSTLPGLGEAGAANVVEWCRLLGLCDDHGGLKALAHEVAENDEAPIPEQGVYDLWLAQHPLLGARVLAAERLAPTQVRRKEELERLPFEPAIGEVFTSVREPSRRFVLRGFPSKHGQVGCVLRPSEVSCRLRWTLDFEAERDRWRLSGQIEGARVKGKRRGKTKVGLVPLQHEAESVGLDLWQLMDVWGEGVLASVGRWSRDERRLATPLSELSDGERESFRKTLTLSRVEIPGKGSYPELVIEDLPIGPLSASEAQRWARARLERRLAGQLHYRSRDQLRELFASLVDGSPLEPSSPQLPGHDELVHASLEDRRRYWSLAAPVDLNPAREAEGGRR